MPAPLPRVGARIHRRVRPAPLTIDVRDKATSDVIGFLLTGSGVVTVHVSGDNVSLPAVRQVADRVGRVQTAILFAGAVRLPILEQALLTFDAARVIDAMAVLGANRLVLAHVDSWSHLTEDRRSTEQAVLRSPFANTLALASADEAG